MSHVGLCNQDVLCWILFGRQPQNLLRTPTLSAMSTMTRSARKRQHVETTDTVTDSEDPGIQIASSTPSPSSEFWLSDGNVILQAESTQFRVHKSVLSMHSTVFRDMFTVPQPDEQPKVEGCPIVHLSDAARDVDCLLGAFYARPVSVSYSRVNE